MLYEAQGGGYIVGNNSGGKTIVGVVSPLYHLFKGIELEDALDWAENLQKVSEIELNGYHHTTYSDGQWMTYTSI